MKNIHLMGILNVTPDSFSDGGKYSTIETAVEHALDMERMGADIIDIGGESTKPGAEKITAEEELSRVLPVIEALKCKIKIPLSIDTMTPLVARNSLRAGVSMLNDVSGFRDSEMVKIAADFDVPIFCMHMLGNPKTMQNNPFYPEGIIAHLLEWSKERISFLTGQGIDKSKIILDPGIGFGKTVDDNLKIIHNLPKLVQLGSPILIGASRKNFMTRITGVPTERLDAASVAIHAMAVMGGADYIRAHDIEQHRTALDVIVKLREHNKTSES